ncbi:hypothetical protein C0991_012177, partial [Blastosporella zonata]
MSPTIACFNWLVTGMTPAPAKTAAPPVHPALPHHVPIVHCPLKLNHLLAMRKLAPVQVEALQPVRGRSPLVAKPPTEATMEETALALKATAMAS